MPIAIYVPADLHILLRAPYFGQCPATSPPPMYVTLAFFRRLWYVVVVVLDALLDALLAC